jgi:hypothetical protein
MYDHNAFPTGQICDPGAAPGRRKASLTRRMFMHGARIPHRPVLWIRKPYSIVGAVAVENGGGRGGRSQRRRFMKIMRCVNSHPPERAAAFDAGLGAPDPPGAPSPCIGCALLYLHQRSQRAASAIPLRPPHGRYALHRYARFGCPWTRVLEAAASEREGR